MSVIDWIGLDVGHARARFALVRWIAATDWLAFAYAGLVALMISPVLIWPIPRAADIVNHWARLTLLNMPPADPLNAFYAVKFALIPDLGVDLVYLALSSLASAETVARLAWALAIALPAWGAWRLHRLLFARPQLSILLVPPISYNLVVTVGLVNYGLGMGIALLALAFALVPDRPRWPRLAVLNLVSVALLFCHALALLAFGLAFVLFEVSRTPWRPGRADLARAALAPTHIALGLLGLAFAERTPTGFEIAGDKSFVFNAPFFAMTDYDLLLGVAAVAILAAGAASRRLTVAPAARVTLAAIAAIVLLMPSAWGTGNLLDARLAVFWAYLAIAALGFDDSGRFVRPAAAAALIALSAARIASVAPAWSLYEREVEEMRTTFAAIPTGARVLIVKPPGEICHDREMPMLNNVTALAVIDRRAMVNTLFADPGMQPIRPRDPALAAAPKIAMSSRWLEPEDRAPLGALLDRPWANPFVHWRDHFDTVVSLHGFCYGRIDAPGLEHIAGSALVDVYRAR